MRFDKGNEGRRTPLWSSISDYGRASGAQLIVIDTAADTFGGNEIYRSHVRQFVTSGLGRLARDIDGTILLCVHPSRHGLDTGIGTSGSTAWNNSVRSRLYLERANDNQPGGAERILSRKKSNYGPIEGGKIGLVWDDGVFTPLPQPTELEVVTARLAARGLFLVCLDELTAQGRRVSSSPHASNYAPRAMAPMPTSEGATHEALAAAMDDLLQQEAIRVEHVGSPSRQHEKIIRVEREPEDSE